jgi:hypothetical protein
VLVVGGLYRKLVVTKLDRLAAAREPLGQPGLLGATRSWRLDTGSNPEAQRDA